LSQKPENENEMALVEDEGPLGALGKRPREREPRRTRTNHDETVHETVQLSSDRLPALAGRAKLRIHEWAM
jgi:hypothetical protein